MPSFRPRMPLLAMTWVLRQCVLCTPLHANGSPGPVAGGATRLCCTVLPPEAQPAQTSVGEDFRSVSPPGTPRPHGESQEIVAVIGDSVEVGPVAAASDLLDLDLDVDAGGEVEALERL